MCAREANITVGVIDDKPERLTLITKGGWSAGQCLVSFNLPWI